MWQAIESNAEGNLALSPEEASILHTIRSQEAEEVYPLFINGRPGSGKSTILQYLFADYLYLHLKAGALPTPAAPPIYLTYSERLLQSAKASVRTILQCNSHLALSGPVNIDDAWVTSQFDRSFDTFQAFLLSLLPESARARFAPSNRIDYPDFRHWWETTGKRRSNAEIRSLSSELVWHIIRTYIKGMTDDASGFVDSDSYQELPERQKTVQQATFDLVFREIWPQYQEYCDEDKGRWDTQDLARCVLSQADLDLSRHPVVFCDEAQDFTKIELQLILRLSLFSQRSIEAYQLKRVPFAFAGDPFQTLNPTGFDWGAVKAGFHEKIVQELDRAQRARLRPNYRELSYNYRSTDHIVRFCNLLQLLRGVLFGITQLRPQQVWFEDQTSAACVYYDVADPICRQQLEAQSEQVIILPCQEGEEQAYVEADPFLSTITSNSQDRNFFSSMSAKGLEFSRVVLYKFGDDCLRHYPELLGGLTGEGRSATGDQTLPFKYFLNRLYVAASRPKRRLIIVDTEQGLAQFWTQKELTNFDGLVAAYVDNDGWTTRDLSWVQMGVESNWSADRDNSLEIAKILREAGIYQRDPYKLRLAAANLRRAGRDYDASECDAIRLEIELKWKEAGRVYGEMGRSKDALRCYWRGRCYSEIVENPAFADTIEQRAAFFMNGARSAAVCERFLESLHQELQGPSRDRIIASEGWGDIVGSALEALGAPGVSIQNWAQTYARLGMIRALGIAYKDSRSLGEIAFRAGQYADAAQIWDRTDPSMARQVNYRVAKAYSTAFPENLPFLFQLGRFEELLAQWEASRSRKLTTTQAEQVGHCLVQIGRLADALAFLNEYPSDSGYKDLMAKHAARHDDELAFQVALEMLAWKCRGGQWQAAIDVVKSEGKSPESRDRLVARLITELATSKTLPAESSSVKTPVAEYLRDLFIVQPWRGLVSVRVAGAAIEKADRIVDSLEFYELIWKSSHTRFAAQDQQFAKERWLKRKVRQAEYSRQAGKHNDAEKQRQEAHRQARNWRIEEQRLPEYPEVEVESEEGVTTKDTPKSDSAERIEVPEQSEPTQLTEEQAEMIRSLLLLGKYSPEQIAQQLHFDLADVQRIANAVESD